MSLAWSKAPKDRVSRDKVQIMIPIWFQEPMAGIVAILWMIFQPLLFGLIGAEVNISQIDGSTVGE